ncbi:MAG: universal stress protein, partial [Elusimicrobia bacterium]|nr:universal stress protein [Elusimicrobiota bacterium]
MERPNPDELLRRVRSQEDLRGRLKLFFGANAGVGKTYAMLEAARLRRKEGIDVVVGLAETHGRAETAALLEGFEVLPRRRIEYKGVALLEFDLDAALARKPGLILVDELAHTNAEGCRHAKRWQDVQELLEAGISVYSTLNVQHWESLNDVVAQVTGVVVRETVPDTFLRRADEIELVDIPAEELLKRLREGKVYLGAAAERAAAGFFKPENLSALRELALRHTAERVDVQVQALKPASAEKAWPVADRVLVGVTASPLSSRLVRAAHRIAGRLRCEWLAVHVETPRTARLPPEDKARLLQTLRLAEELGAETVTLTGDDAARALVDYARSRNVSRIVIGKPHRTLWR